MFISLHAILKMSHFALPLLVDVASVVFTQILSGVDDVVLKVSPAVVLVPLSVPIGRVWCVVVPVSSTASSPLSRCGW
jgi:hypothetical protein